MLAILQGAPAVTAIFGARLFREIAPDGTAMPHATIRQSGGSESYLLDGPGGLQEARVLVTALAKSSSEADAAAGAVIDAVRSFYTGEVDGRQVTAFREGVDVSDYVPGPRAFRRATEIRLAISRA